MAKRPAFLFYPGDWLRNANLRRCSREERGVWIDVLCLMHDSDSRGILRWSLEEIADAVACPVKILESLTYKGVLKGSPKGSQCAALVHTDRNGVVHTLIGEEHGPLWYSSRMVKDEYLKDLASKSGKKGGGNPKLRTYKGASKGSPANANVTVNGNGSDGGIKGGKARHTTWLTPFFDLWESKLGGEPPGGESAAALKRLVDKHGQETVLQHLERYLDGVEPKYLSISKFAQTFGTWNGKPTAGRGMGQNLSRVPAPPGKYDELERRAREAGLAGKADTNKPA